ncbi:response regulator transcription factor [Streptomyces sp. M2CJ-2]|uniref:response regulator transcription factor n=1 Tax=Streptomyces sp. M2CJ-2 TaxID=2803948 RepID=UPI001927DE9E|nr:response regulator transcription factor [Streptomyces sp. M2CJ-2]MBL3668643.1 response regulator transcription factor [Streptomyces sp. M2CJ-2]
MKLLVVEANERVSAALGAALEEQGLEAVCASTGRAALELLDRARPDVVLLDLALPDCDGFGLCGAMRAASTVPILVTTARGDHLSCVRALDLGADDHLVKPYNLAELLARTRAVLRRGRPAEPAGTDSGTGAAPAAAAPGGPFEEPSADLLLAGRVRIDLRERAVLVDGAPTELPDDEFDILAVLARRPGRTLRADQIVEEILRAHRSSLRATLPTRIASLRARLGPSRLVESPEDGCYRLPAPEPYA